MALILNHDAEKEGFEVALNKYSDWTDDEFNGLFKLGSGLPQNERIIEKSRDDVSLQGLYRKPKKKQEVEG
jgi:hypothetical protein